MAKKWKIAIIKDTSAPMLGGHGLHVAFRGLPNVEVVAHVDSNADNLAQKLSFSGAERHYLAYDEMLEREAPDIVVLCSRHPDDHLPQIEAAASKGCHIYCEKPLAANLEAADSIVQLAERHKIKIGVAHVARHALKFRAMKQMVDGGEIGEPLTVYGRGRCDHRGGGEDLVVLGTHILDLMLYFFGHPDHVSAEITREGCPVQRGDRTETVEPVGPVAGDRVLACLAWNSGVRGTFESQANLFRFGDAFPQLGLSVHGTRGTLSLRLDDARDRPLLLSREAGPPESDLLYQQVTPVEERHIPGAAPLDYGLCGQPDIPRAPMFLEGNRYGVWDLMQAIESGRQPLANIYDARAVQEAIYGMYASHLANGSRIALPPVERRHPLLL